MKPYLLVFDDGSGSEFRVSRFIDSLDDGATGFTMDGHVCFFRSSLALGEIEDILTRLVGSRLFFVTEVGESPFVGRMLGTHWDLIKQHDKLSSAA